MEEGMKVAKEEGISFLETSAKSGTNCLRAMQTILEGKFVNQSLLSS